MRTLIVLLLLLPTVVFSQIPEETAPFDRADVIFVKSDSSEMSRYITMGKSLISLGYRFKHSDALFKLITTEEFRGNDLHYTISVTAAVIPDGIRLTAVQNRLNGPTGGALYYVVSSVSYRLNKSLWNIEFEELERVASFISDSLPGSSVRYGKQVTQ